MLIVAIMDLHVHKVTCTHSPCGGRKSSTPGGFLDGADLAASISQLQVVAHRDK
jgi:hypothetical protein